MAARLALLIGVSDYGEGFEPLPGSLLDVREMQRVLSNPEQGAFQVQQTLENPDRAQAETAIEAFFEGRSPDDLLLFYFSGHGDLGSGGMLHQQLHLCCKESHKVNQRLRESTALSAATLKRQMDLCKSQKIIIILDCCYSGAIADLLKKGDGDEINYAEFKATGRVILAFSSASKTALQAKDGLSLYTGFLLEGMEGAVSTDRSPWITARDLHHHAEQRFEIAKGGSYPPKIIATDTSFDLPIAKAPKPDAESEYRDRVTRLFQELDQELGLDFTGVIDDPLDLGSLETLRSRLHLPVEIAAEIEAKIQAPYLVRAQQRQAYSQYFLKIAETGYRPDARQQKRLAEICQDLGLSSEDALQLNQVLTQKFNLQARPIAPPSPPVTSEDSVLTSLPLPSIGEKAPPQQPSVAQKAPPPATPVAQKTVSQKPASALQPKPLVDQANVSTTPAQYFRRRQVLKYLGFGGIGVMVAAIIANFRGLFGVSSSPSSPPPKLEPSFSPSSKSPSPTKLESFSFETVTVDQTGKIKQRQTKSAQAFTEDLGNGISLIMVQIPAGSFQMGSPTREAGRINDEGPQHPVKLPTFFIGKFEVTQAQWAAVAKLEKVNIDLNPEPANFKGSDPRGNGEAARPVEQISWFEAVEFCDRLSRKTGKTYRLPSEAEWEYACRAGTTTPFYFGETISTDLANYNGTSTYGNGAKGQYREQTTPVGSFPANAFGLHDMHGNVFEWCADHWHENYDRAPTDGSVWEAGGNQRRRCLRGCSWDNNPRVCRSAYRGRITPVYLSFNIGFRVVGCC